MEYIAEIKNVSKKFGDETAVREVSLSLEPGKIYGIAGRNGSGKTVLFKMIIGFLRPTTGKIIVNGKEVGKDTDFAATKIWNILRPSENGSERMRSGKAWSRSDSIPTAEKR